MYVLSVSFTFIILAVAKFEWLSRPYQGKEDQLTVTLHVKRDASLSDARSGKIFLMSLLYQNGRGTHSKALVFSVFHRAEAKVSLFYHVLWQHLTYGSGIAQLHISLPPHLAFFIYLPSASF